MVHSKSVSRLTWSRWWRRLLVALRRANFFRILEAVSVILLVAMLATSWFEISSVKSNQVLIPSGRAAALLIGSLIPAMTLLVLIGRRLALRRSDTGTASLHVRLVFLFSLIAAVPTLLVAIFAAILFQSGIEFWFSDSSRGMLENANKLARGYYEQNLRDVGNETVTMAGDLRSYLSQSNLASPEFAEGYSYQVVGRKLNESAILQKGNDGKLRTAAIVDPDQNTNDRRITVAMLSKVDNGEPVVVEASANRIEAFTAIDRNSGVYLYTARNSDALMLSQWERAQSVRQAYDMLTSRARSLQVRFNFALFFVSLGLVWFTIFLALRVADRQVRPLTNLVSAARMVGGGNYAMRIEGRTGSDEIGLLNRAFNRMTAQIEQQTQALVGANRQMEDRRAFIEAVLESVSAGIISVDRSGGIVLMNSAARKLLLEDADLAEARTPLADLAPQMAAVLDAKLAGGLVRLNRGGELLTLAVKIAQAPKGHVITFEDITRQLIDQRQAAWSDVARRIAHEIKNPLTPIQLATERLNRRYRKQIAEDGDLFDELTSTIIRQVGDLRKMVDEFSSFARLPKPVFRSENAVDLIKQALFLQDVAHPAIDFSFDVADDVPGAIACDRHQFGQAMTNVLKNAVEAVESRAAAEECESGNAFAGKITVSVSRGDERIRIDVIDNGIGLPDDADRIAEPYVTTREKGTGLGLAIVTKIVEEHGGEIAFTSPREGGTRVTLTFARDPLAREGTEAAE